MIPQPNIPAKPGDFIRRKAQIEAFRSILQQGLATGTTSSVAVLGDWGIGKSSLLLKFASICARSEHRMLPITLSVGEELGNYRGLAESLLDNLAETLAATDTVTGRIRAEVQNWELKRVKVGGLSFDREARRFLSSGSSLLRHALAHAWRHFLKPTHFLGATFFLDDLDNLTGAAKVALAIRDQFQSFGIERMNYSVCFSARADYFSWVRNLAEPAVRFYSKVYLAPFTLDETNEYLQAVFASHPGNLEELAEWLYEKTLGHPYFLAFVSRQLLAVARGSPVESPCITGLRPSANSKERNSAPIWCSFPKRTQNSSGPSPEETAKSLHSAKSVSNPTASISEGSRRKVCSFAPGGAGTSSTTGIQLFLQGLKP